MNFLFYICDTLGFLRVVSLIRTILNIIRFAVPLGLIIWIALDLFKNVVNPENKDGVKKIGIRFGAAIIVFLLPTIIPLLLQLFDDITGNIDYETSKCYLNGNSNCISNINSYLNCKDKDESEKQECQEFRSCNSFTLDKDCKVTTELNNNNCKDINSSNSVRFYENGFLWTE